MSFEPVTDPCTPVLSRWLKLTAWTLISICLATRLAHASDSLDPFAYWPMVPDQELASLRGGFTTTDGLEINVGLTQLVMIDGVLKTQLNLNLSGQEHTSGAPSSNMPAQDKLIQLIQSGDHNMVTPDVPEHFSSGVLTVIQNSLDMRLIQNLTLLNVDVSHLSQFRTSAMGEAISRELIRSLR